MKYLVEVFWNDDEGYVAVVPDLRGCSAFARFPETLVHGKVLMKDHRDTQSRGFLRVSGSFGNFGPRRRPRPQRSTQIDTQTMILPECRKICKPRHPGPRRQATSARWSAAPLATRRARQLGADDRQVRIEPMRYLIEVFWSDDDEGYIAIVPELRGCSAFGLT